MTKEYSDYLAHYGVLGMRWGHRKDEDKRRLARPESSTWKKKDKRTLSDEELNRRNQRLNKENQYANNIDNSHPVRKELKQYAKQIFVMAAVGLAADAFKKHLGSSAPVSFVRKWRDYKLPL